MGLAQLQSVKKTSYAMGATGKKRQKTSDDEDSRTVEAMIPSPLNELALSLSAFTQEPVRTVYKDGTMTSTNCVGRQIDGNG